MDGNKLKKLRENKGLLQKELADILKISTSSIGMYEQGRREPDNETLKNIAQFFGVSIDYLLGNIVTNSNEEKIREKNALRNALKDAGFLKADDLTNEELDKLMKFLVANINFLKEKK